MGRETSKHSGAEVSNRAETYGFPFGKMVLLIAVIFAAIFPFTEIGNKVMGRVSSLLGAKTVERVVEVEKEVYVDKIVKVPVEVKIPSGSVSPPVEERVLAPSHAEASTPLESLTKLSSSSDIQLRTEVEAKKSTGLASADRRERGAYEIEYKVKVKLPKPAVTLDELQQANPALGSIFPGLQELTKTAKVSPYFYEIYKNKADRVKRDAPKMKSLLSRHNFFDLQTIVNFTASNGRKVMIMQADMDVVSDGSDGDRLPTMPEKIVNSTFYQPSTSYFWKKQGTTQNPMIPGLEARVKKAKLEIASPSTTTARKNWLKSRLKVLETKIEDMKHHSYLIAEHDPFIVIPINMLTNMSDRFAPKVGDYAVVVYQEKLYPCIVGDGGPTFKVGEASLRIAKELNKRASSYSRPVSDLSVTYLVFPFSRERKKSPPNYEKWRQKCDELLKEIGGLGEGYSLETWKDTFPKKNDA